MRGQTCYLVRMDTLFEVITIGPFYMLVTSLVATALLEFTDRTGLDEFPYVNKACIVFALVVTTLLVWIILDDTRMPLDPTL